MEDLMRDRVGKVGRGFALCVLLCGGLAHAAAPGDGSTTGVADPPTTEGHNLALARPYVLDPPPNDAGTSSDAERTVLTDGRFTGGPFWLQATTVGWARARPVTIVIDLGETQPIAGASFSTAAGAGGVSWPSSIRVLVSDDGTSFTEVGDLVLAALEDGLPPPAPYAQHRFVTHALATRGRHVAFVVDQHPYAFVDEIEVFAGPSALLGRAPRGPAVSAPLRPHFEGAGRVADMARWRLQADLLRIRSTIDDAPLTSRRRRALDRRAKALADAIDARPQTPDDDTTRLPLNALHTRVWALNAPLLRARGFPPISAWSSHRYDPLHPLDAPRAAAPPPSIGVLLARGERRFATLNLTNSTDRARSVSVRALRGGRPTTGLSLRAVHFTDTARRSAIGTALSAPAMGPLDVLIPAGTTGQVFIEVDGGAFEPGTHELVLDVRHAGARVMQVPLVVRVADVGPSAVPTVAVGGWDETNNAGGLDVTGENMASLIRTLRAWGVNTPVSNPAVLPEPGTWDADGNLVGQPDFTAWDIWMSRWPGVAHIGVFANFGSTWMGEPVGTPRFHKMVGAWATAWVEHAAGQGIRPEQIKIQIVDEPRSPGQDAIVVAWGRALHAAQPGLRVWSNPVHGDPARVVDDFYTESNVVSPNATRFREGSDGYRASFRRAPGDGRELWFYACSGPAKLLDPASYYLGQFWLAGIWGATGSFFWSFGDEGGDSWNAYAQPRIAYSPLYLGRTTVTETKHLAAILEGAQDHALITRLYEQLATPGRSVADIARVEQTLDGLDAVEPMLAPGQEEWAVPKDRAVFDRLREGIIDALVPLPVSSSAPTP